MTILRTRTVWARPKSLAPRRGFSPEDFTPEEQANIKRALRSLKRRLGTWRDVASALGVTYRRVRVASFKNTKPSLAIAFRLARVVGVGLGEILSGAWPAPGTCPMCGGRLPESPPAPKP